MRLYGRITLLRQLRRRRLLCGYYQDRVDPDCADQPKVAGGAVRDNHGFEQPDGSTRHINDLPSYYSGNLHVSNSGTNIGGSETPQATAGKNASAEPTKGDVLRQIYLDRGFWEARAIDLRLSVPGGTRLAFEIYTPSAISVLSWLEYEE